MAYILRSASIEQKKVLEKPSILTAIERLKEDDLSAIVTTAGLPNLVIQTLKTRQIDLAASYSEWLRDAITYIDIEKRYMRR